MTNQLKEPRFCPTLAPPRLLMVKSFILTWKKNPKWPILCFYINMHAFNNFYIKNVYIYRYFACHNRISGKKSLKVIYHSIEEYGKTAIFDQYIQSSWKLIWTWEVGFRLFFLTTPCQTILRPELQPERGCVEKSTFCIVCVSNNPHVKQKSMPSTSFVHWIYFSHQIKLEIWYIRICGLPILSNIEMCVGVFLQGTISTLSMLRFLISMILRV